MQCRGEPAFSWTFGWDPPTMAPMWVGFVGPGHNHGTALFNSGGRSISACRVAFTGNDTVAVTHGDWASPFPPRLDAWGAGKEPRWQIGEGKAGWLNSATQAPAMVASRETWKRLATLAGRSTPHNFRPLPADRRDRAWAGSSDLPLRYRPNPVRRGGQGLEGIDRRMKAQSMWISRELRLT